MYQSSLMLTSLMSTLIFIVISHPVEAQSRWQYGYSSGETPRCRDETPLLTTDSIGPINPFLTLQQVESACAHVEYRLVQTIGAMMPVVNVRLGDAIVQVELNDTFPSSSIYRINSSSTSLRTVDGFGPGSPVVDMAETWPIRQFLTGEGVYAVTFANQPGLSFIFPWPTPMLSIEDEERMFSDKDASVLSDSVVVTEVLLLSGW